MIATVIIVAVTIAVAIAVAFWMTGIVGLFTSAEKLEVVSLYATPAQGGGWDVKAIIRNTGTTVTSIDNVFVNGIPYTECQGSVTVSPAPPVTITAGNTTTITITLKGTCGSTTFSPGGSVEVKFHTTGGKEYPKLTVLP